jgi:hypothetical protein
MKKPPSVGMMTSTTPEDNRVASIDSDEHKSKLVEAVFKQNNTKPMHSSNLRHNSGNTFGAV